LANLKTKLLESIILDTVKMDNNYNDYQFGFLKKKVILLLCALLQLSRLLSTILTEVLHVLSISATYLITLTTGSSLNSYLLTASSYALYTCWFLPRDAMHKRGLCCHAVSVCLYVRPSVTFVDHVKTNKHIFEIFSPSVATPF